MHDLRQDVSRIADDLVSRARPLADDLMRRARRQEPAAMQEERSFLGGSTGQVAGAAALGLLAGIAFTAVRKAAVQGTEALAGDWFEVLKAEHKAVDKLFEHLMLTDERQKLRRALILSRITHALTKHAAQEEMVVYPALKESSGEGQAMHLYEEHARIKIFIHELQEIGKDTPLWMERARAFRDFVQDHVRQEEDEIFPAYHGRMSPQQNRKLTMALHREGLKLA